MQISMFTKAGSSPHEYEWVFLYLGTASCLKYYHKGLLFSGGKKREGYEIHEDDIKERKLEVLEDLSDGLPPSRDKKILIHASTEISPVILCTVLARHTQGRSIQACGKH